jgi:predicted Fe-S protein YdhL (DUF1289 family)
MDEIVNWAGYDEAERRAIVAALPARMAASQQHPHPNEGKPR